METERDKDIQNAEGEDQFSLPTSSYQPALDTTTVEPRNSVDKLPTQSKSTQLPLIQELTKIMDTTSRTIVEQLLYEGRIPQLADSFPYKQPYEAQIQMMTSIQQAIKEGKHLLLESPTGTGKTLVLLHSTLSFERMTVVYASRTHSQLTQVVNESRKIGNIKGIVLASRDLYCIYDPIKQCDDKNYWCNSKPQVLKKLKNIPKCPFKPITEEGFFSPIFLKKCQQVYKETNGIIQPQEDLVKICKKYGVCPYYYCRWATKRSKLILCPYNFVTTVSIRRSSELFIHDENEQNPSEFTLVMDEAHNVEDSLMDSLTFTFTEELMNRTIETIEFHKKRIPTGHEHRESIELIDDLILTIQNFQVWVDNRVLTQKDSEQNTFDLFDPDALLPFIDRIPSQHRLVSAILIYVELLDDVEKILDHPQLSQYLNPFTTQYIEMLIFYFEVFRKPQYIKYFKIIVTEKENTRDILFRCLSPSLPMSLMQQEIRSIIFASGTLSPMKAMAQELDINEHPYKNLVVVPGYHTLSTTHVVPPNHVFGKTISCGPNGKKFEFTQKTSSDEKMFEEAGKTIFNVLSNSPGGGLVFFTSYSVLNKVVSIWKNQGMYPQLNKIKMIFIESKDKKVFKKDFNSYRHECSKGAVYLGVFRGKLSEGIDFGDDLARVVIVVGIPFPSIGDINVKLKRKYNDEAKRFNNEVVSGSDWYLIQAIRAVNQAVGRVIRHIKDYGAFLLIDGRYSRSNIRQMLSGWIQKSISNAQRGWEKDLIKFYNEMKEESNGTFVKAETEVKIERRSKSDELNKENKMIESVMPNGKIIRIPTVQSSFATQRRSSETIPQYKTTQNQNQRNSSRDVFSNQAVLRERLSPIVLKCVPLKKDHEPMDETQIIDAIPPNETNEDHSLSEFGGKRVLDAPKDVEKDDLMIMTPTFTRRKTVEISKNQTNGMGRMSTESFERNVSKVFSLSHLDLNVEEDEKRNERTKTPPLAQTIENKMSEIIDVEEESCPLKRCESTITINSSESSLLYDPNEETEICDVKKDE